MILGCLGALKVVNLPPFAPVKMPSFATGLLPPSSSGPSAGSSATPPPTVDPRLAQAASTAGGQALTHDGLQPVKVLPGNGELTQFLNTQTNSTDTYVVFGKPGQPQVDTPSPGYVPDGVVGLNSGTIVALNESFSDGRGTLCYNNSNAKILTGFWLPLNQFLRGKSLGASYLVGHGDVPEIPAGDNNNVTCYLYTVSG